MNYFLLLLSFLFSSVNNNLFSKEKLNTNKKKIDVFVGESIYLKLVKGCDIHLSRRGIIFADYAGDAQWRLTGLKTGSLAIKAKCIGEKQKIPPLWWITVKEKKIKNIKLSKGKLPLWACNKNSFTCQDQGHYMGGLIFDIDLFYQGMALCQQRSACHFFASLEERSRKNLAFSLQNTFKEKWDFKVNKKGVILAEHHCQVEEDLRKKREKELKDFLRVFYPKAPFLVSCRKKLKQKIWLLKAYVYLDKKSYAQNLGLKPNLLVELDINEGLKSLNFAASLRAALARNQLNLIAKPELKMYGQKKAFIQSGGEILYYSPRKISKSTKIIGQWKSYGLKLEAQVLSYHQAKATLDFNFSLSQAKNASKSQFLSHKIKSLIELNLTEEMLAGTINISTKGQHKTLIPIFEKVPILGPFFQVIKKENTSTRLYLSFKLESQNK